MTVVSCFVICFVEKKMTTRSSILAWKSHGLRILVGYSPWSRKESDTTEQLHFISLWGFPHSWGGKDSACHAGHPSSIPGWGRSPGEGIGYPLQYSLASLVDQVVKNLPAVQETSVQFLGWEDPLEKGKATHSSILAWRIPLGSQRVRHDWATFTSLFLT